MDLIDLTGKGNNSLTLELKDVLDISGVNLINAATKADLGWTDGSYAFAATETRHQLVIAGDPEVLGHVRGDRSERENTRSPLRDGLRPGAMPLDAADLRSKSPMDILQVQQQRHLLSRRLILIRFQVETNDPWPSSQTS